jgi:TIR domain
MFEYDIFLSHAAQDFQEVDEVRSILLAAKFRVYCDRYDDKLLDRTKVTAATANTLKDRMRRCNAMVFVVTRNSSGSKWMPWELGFFDGVRGKVLVYPVDDAALTAANEQEYLSLFKILTPGSLPQQLEGEVHGVDGIIRELRDQPLFAPADVAITKDYGKRLAQVQPFDLAQMAQVQNEIWRAWFRLWGIGR